MGRAVLLFESLTKLVIKELKLTCDAFEIATAPVLDVSTTLTVAVPLASAVARTRKCVAPATATMPAQFAATAVGDVVVPVSWHGAG